MKPRLLLLSTDPRAVALATQQVPGCEFELVADAQEAALRLAEGRFAGVLELEAQADDLALAAGELAQVTDELEERLEHEVTSMHVLHRFAVELNATRDLAQVAQLTADVTFDLCAGRGVRVQLWDDRVGTVSIEADAGPEMSAQMHEEPLVVGDVTLGEIVVDQRSPDGASLASHEIDLLAMIALPAALATEGWLGRRQHEDAQHRMILALARLAERRDAHKGRHIERVSQLCRLICEALVEDGHYTARITPAFVDDLSRASGLHDIGKVAIPDSILLKPGSLGEEEWRVMRTHAEVGARVIEGVLDAGPCPDYLEVGHEIALCHHEKWDGSGYPRGLSAEKIPLSARILALADIYDALTTRRPYKEPWPHARAVDWIRELAGTHLDPLVVESFLERGAQVDEIRARLSDEEGSSQRVIALAIGAV